MQKFVVLKPIICLQVNCRGYNAFGRRKRDLDSQNNTDMAYSGDLLSGQLREEITIQSNAILTFERREERLSSPAESMNLSTKTGNKNLFTCFFFSFSGRPKKWRYMRVHDRIHNSLDINSTVGSGSGCGGRVVLVDGLPSSTKINGSTATSPRVPQSAVHHPRTHGRTEPRLPHVATFLLTN